MSAFKRGQKQRRRRGLKKWIVIVPLVVVSAAAVAAITWFSQNIQPVDDSGIVEYAITVQPGASEEGISRELESAGVIRSALAYRIRAKLNGKQGSMRAGQYEVASDSSVDKLLDQFANGDIRVDLVTILPAQRIAQLEQSFLKAGFSVSEVSKALNPTTYLGHPALSEKPPGASLEGYIFPESFQRTASVELSDIIELSLDEMAKLLSPKIRTGLASQGLTTHEGVILASIIEKEVGILADKPIVAQVFLKRYNLGISLGSDPTAHYGASLQGLKESVATDTFYNTRIYAGLPPGPISNVSPSSLTAVVSPSDTDFLYFVAGDDGTTHFSTTLAEHELNTAKYCTVLCR